MRLKIIREAKKKYVTPVQHPEVRPYPNSLNPFEPFEDVEEPTAELSKKSLNPFEVVEEPTAELSMYYLCVSATSECGWQQIAKIETHFRYI